MGKLPLVKPIVVWDSVGMDVADVFRRRLEAVIEDRGLKPTVLSTRITGSNNTLIKNLLDRKSAPRLDTVAKIAAALDLSVAYLIGETDDPTRIASSQQSPEARLLWVDRVEGGFQEHEGQNYVTLRSYTDEGTITLVFAEGSARSAAARLGAGADKILADTVGGFGTMDAAPSTRSS